jgi:hypothetical protein
VRGYIAHVEFFSFLRALDEDFSGEAGYNYSLDKEPTYWVEISVRTSTGKTYFFMGPRSVARELSESMIVQIVGRWTVRQIYWHLLATRLVCYNNPGNEVGTYRLARMGRTARCRFCGRKLGADERWGITRNWTIECPECSSFRDGRDPGEFEAFRRRLLRERKRRPGQKDSLGV